MTVVEHSSERTNRAVTTSSGTPRILIVEDEETLSLLLTYNLEAEGFSVECVERGDEADIRLIENPPDLVILDWMLPGASGIEICRRMRARQATRSLPILNRGSIIEAGAPTWRFDGFGRIAMRPANA